MIRNKVTPSGTRAICGLSAKEDDAYFGKGIAEELLNALTKFPELKVASRTSAFSFEGQKVDLREIGQKLGVT
ncbi:MAG: hypothetical protein GY732_11425 [Gammaproteobacteria bacterium]|nr:hypothetical protein [Gammaproteobacteria bacterium]